MKKYLFIMKIRILHSITYRSAVFFTLFVNLAYLLANSFLWNAVYKSKESIAGVNKQQMVTYAVLSIILVTVMKTEIHYKVDARIKSGQIALDFLRPFYLPFAWLAEDLGNTFSCTFFYLGPMVLFSVIFHNSIVPYSIPAFLFFLLSCILSYLILWLVNIFMTTLFFWTMDLRIFFWIKDIFITFFAGSIIPIWFFPDVLQKIIMKLPFVYIYQAPLGIYIGKYQGYEILEIMLVQLFWVFTLFFSMKSVWSRTQKHVLIQGG